MSNSIGDRFAFLEHPNLKRIYGDFSPFYVVISICTVLGVFLLILNVICCCCSKYSDYWQDRHTGNRWLVSIWSATPHKQPSLDYTELEKGGNAIVVAAPRPPLPAQGPSQPRDYLELQKRESEI